MKNILAPVLLLLAGVLVAGCNGQKAEIVALKAKITLLELRAAEADLFQSNAREYFQLTLKLSTNYHTYALDVILLQGEIVELGLQLEELTNALRRGIVPLPTRAAASARMSNGVPVAIYNEIFTAAQREWPGNFTMQSYEVRRQLEAYQRLHDR